MKRFALIALLVAAVSSQVGCGWVAMGYAGWKREIRNDRAQRTYSKSVASHAGDNKLVGTWTRQEEIPLGKKIFNKRDESHTLTLFNDTTYIYRLETREPYAHHISASKGKWIKDKPGVLLLTPEHAETGDEPLTINLDDWTNPFVQANDYLHQYIE